MDAVVSRRRLAPLRTWVLQLYNDAAQDRQAMHLGEYASGREMLLGQVEVLVGEWSPVAGRIAAGKPIRDPVGLISCLERSLFDLPNVVGLFMEEGFEMLKRYVEGVELLRLVLLCHLSRFGGI